MRAIADGLLSPVAAIHARRHAAVVGVALFASGVGVLVTSRGLGATVTKGVCGTSKRGIEVEPDRDITRFVLL